MSFLTKTINKFMAPIKSAANTLVKFVRASRKNQLITLVVVVILITSGVVLALVIAKNNAARTPAHSRDTLEQTQKPKVVRIESNIPGITMEGSPYCGSSVLKKPTPYDCELNSDQSETSIIAPTEAVLDGKTYVFQTWDGCSQGNTDKRICTINMDGEDTKKLMATYLEKSISTNSQQKKSSGNSPIACPAASQFIIINPQTFVPNNPEMLILYNKTKDYQQATNAQFLSGNFCKEIPLTNELKATKKEGPLNSGFGLAASSYVTRSSERTTTPKGGYNYIAVVDLGRHQHFLAIFRNNGDLVIDTSGVMKRFDPTGNNAHQNSEWKFKGWIGSHTLLISIPWKISGPVSDCMAYDVDANTHSEVQSSLCVW